MKQFLTPPELSEYFISVGKNKAALSAGRLAGLAVLAGFFIGLAAHLATTVSTGWTLQGEEVFFGLQKLLTGAVFSTGLMMVIIPGSELFTGNNLMTIALWSGGIRPGAMLRNWLLVYLANFAGSLILAYSIAGSTGLLASEVGGTAIRIAWSKVALSPGGLPHWAAFFSRAVWCNFLVCIAVMMSTAALDVGGRIAAVFFPILAFVTSGFEHVVANMYFIPAGIIATRFPGAVAASGLEAGELADLTWQAMFTANIIPVTLGNIVGGALLVGTLYWAIFLRSSPS